jgi:thiol-disulfide isomerase/thioredoxin
MGILTKAKGMDFYRKIPRDMTQGTYLGTALSITAFVLISYLLIFETKAYVRTQFETKVVIDRSVDGELLRINFNVSFPSLSCEFASVDVGDALGLTRFNLTKTVFKRPIDGNFKPTGPLAWAEKTPGKDGKEHIDEGEMSEAQIVVERHKEALATGKVTHSSAEPLTTEEELQAFNEAHSVTLVNFYAPWCPWSQRLQPVFDAAAIQLHEAFNTNAQNMHSIALGRVNCVEHEDLCRKHHIQGYPTIRIFTRGSDLIAHGRHTDHASYHGDRTVNAIVEFGKSMVDVPADTIPVPQGKPTAENDSKPKPKPPNEQIDFKVANHADVVQTRGSSGCSITGFVLVKKVPGHLFFTADAKNGHSFDVDKLNVTHQVHHFYFGQALSNARLKYMEKFHRGEKEGDWHDKLMNDFVVSHSPRISHEHYLQTVLTTMHPSGAFSQPFNVYEYTQHTHSVTTPDGETPRAKFHFTPSPVQILGIEKRREFYEFITTLMAIVGGVYSVMGIIDGLMHNTSLMFKRKMQLGKAM